ncbi:MAG: Rod shape-determining protein MreD [Ekhidna sp.]|uniref:Rod shape-determining protein MreD n=1 Tax=Ekhidna sp. TaxID=2608089 RepID=UPI0032EB9FD4
MTRISINEQILNLILLLLVQLPLIHRVTLFDKAFGFFYVGFLLLLPRTLSRSYLMLIGFLSGLLVDVFTNTPGIHASASVFIMFIRSFWLNVVTDDAQEITNLDISSLKKSGFVYFIFPLVFVHHFLIFTIENGGFHLFGMVLSKVFFSAIFSTVVIFTTNFAITPTRKRV